jgi:acyl-coenzyme A synthetase/AMP-(fatty) acid ligase
MIDSVCSEFSYDKNNESGLSKELTLQVRKVIGPFAAPKKIYIVNDLPKTRSGKVRTDITSLNPQPLIECRG